MIPWKIILYVVCGAVAFLVFSFLAILALTIIQQLYTR
jgi:hypothetical protein